MTVANGTPTQPQLYTYTTAGTTTGGADVFAGQVRYNSSLQNLEIFDGRSWQTWYSNTASVGLTDEAQELLDWARNKRKEEQELKLRMQDSPALQDAYEKFQVINVLTMEKHGS
jgi:hypothetical protein